MKGRQLIAPMLLMAATACNPKSNPDKREAEICFRNERFDSTTTIVQTRELVDHITSSSFSVMVPDSKVRGMAEKFFGRPLVAGPKTWAATEIARGDVLNDQLYDHLPEGARCSEEHNPFSCSKTPEESETLSRLVSVSRSIILETAKSYLSQPAHLMEFYKSKKPIIFDELRCSLQGSEKAERLRLLKEWMENLRTSITVLDKPEFEKDYQAYLQAEEALIREKPEFGSKLCSFASKLCSGVSENVRFDYGRKIDQKRREEIPAYAKFRDAEEKLKGLTPDFDATLFAARRKEENPEILKTYLIILADLEGAIDGIE